MITAAQDGLRHPVTRDALVRAIEEAQGTSRARVVPCGKLADQVLSDWALVERMAAVIGQRPQDLWPSGAWWFRDPDDEHGRDDDKIHTVVTVSSSGFRVTRKPPIGHAHNGGPRGVALRFLGSDDLAKVAQPHAAAAATEARVAQLEDLVGRLRDQLAWRTHRLADQLTELEELPEARLEPEEVRDGVEDAVRLLDELVNGGACHVCGCTHHSPCETEQGPCGWAQGDLHADGTGVLVCTACVGLVDELAVDSDRDDARGDRPRDGEE